MPGVVRFFVPAAVARLGVAMSGLAVLWAVQGAAGSFGSAGVATGAFAVADAAAGPQVARLIDRWGQRRVGSVTLAIFVAAGVALILACAGAQGGGVTGGLAAVMGATVPPVGAMAAARWRKAVGVRAAAVSVEGAVNEVAFLVGPVLVAAVSATVAPWSGLALAVSFVAVGAAGLLSAGATEPEPGGSAAGVLVDRRLLNRGFFGMFAVNLALGCYFGGIGVVITAFALAHGAGAGAGLVTAAGGIVSLGAGLVYGASAKGRPARVMLGASLVMTAGCGLLALAPSMAVLALGYAFVGGCVALVLIPAGILLQRATLAAVYTQALVWMNSASAIGIALAAPLIGHLVQGHGWRIGFPALAALTAALPAVVWWLNSRGSWRGL